MKSGEIVLPVPAKWRPSEKKRLALEAKHQARFAPMPATIRPPKLPKPLPSQLTLLE